MEVIRFRIRIAYFKRFFNFVKMAFFPQFGSYLCGKQRADLRENFIIYVHLDKKVRVKFLKSFGSRVALAQVGALCVFLFKRRPICSTTDVFLNKRIICHRSALLCGFCYSGANHKAIGFSNENLDTCIHTWLPSFPLLSPPFFTPPLPPLYSCFFFPFPSLHPSLSHRRMFLFILARGSGGNAVSSLAWSGANP